MGSKKGFAYCGAEFFDKRGSWEEPAIFGMMQKLANVDQNEMFRTFNMGIGMVVICSESDRKTVAKNLKSCSEIGRVVAGSETVEIRV